MNSRFISIIVPAYNAQKTLRKCINSIINLDFDKDQYEIIIVDNNSTDQTADLIKSFPQVIYVSEKTQGRSHARNSGAKMARGDLLAFVDADVFLEADWLKHLVLNFHDKSIGGGQGRVIPCNHDGQVRLNGFRIRQQNEATFNTNIILRLMYAESPMVNSAACMYRKEAFSLVKGFDVLLERHEDIDLAKRVCLAGFDLVSVKESVAHVEYHGEGWLSYFARSFSEGYTKQRYNAKWQKFFNSKKSGESDIVQLHGKKDFKNNITSVLKLNLRMALEEIFFNVAKGFFLFDSYFLLKAVNSSFKAAGRIMGIMSEDYPDDFFVIYHQDLLKRSILLQNGVEIKIDENLRFVMEKNEILYVLNIQENKIMNFDNFHTFREILNQRAVTGHHQND